MSNCLKPLVLRLCILWSYVPLRASIKRECVANEICFIVLVNEQIMQIHLVIFVSF